MLLLAHGAAVPPHELTRSVAAWRLGIEDQPSAVRGGVEAEP